MPFNTNEFRSSFRQEPAKPNQYEVRLLSLPDTIPLNEYANMVYRCEGAEFPGKTIGTTEYKDYGPVRKIAYGALYNDIQLTFILDGDMGEKSVFDSWHTFIVDNETGSDVKYYDEYIGEVEIIQYDRSGRISHHVKMLEAYPTNTASLPLAWNTNDDYHKLAVDFSYRYWIPLV